MFSRRTWLKFLPALPLIAGREPTKPPAPFQWVDVPTSVPELPETIEDERDIHHRRFVQFLLDHAQVIKDQGGAYLEAKVPFGCGNNLRALYKQVSLEWGHIRGQHEISKKELFMRASCGEARKSLLADANRKADSEAYDHFLKSLVRRRPDIWSNDYPPDGIESFLGYDGITTDGFAIPSDVYGGICTEPGHCGGSWPDWPFGNGDPEYEFWSPLLITYKDWATEWKSKLAMGLKMLKQRFPIGGQEILILTTPTMWKIALETMGQVVNKDKFGFFLFDGVMTYLDCVPEGAAYIFPVSQLRIASLQSEVFEHEQAYVPDFLKHVVTTEFFGNFLFAPRSVVKLFKP